MELQYSPSLFFQYALSFSLFLTHSRTHTHTLWSRVFLLFLYFSSQDLASQIKVVQDLEKKGRDVVLGDERYRGILKRKTATCTVTSKFSASFWILLLSPSHSIAYTPSSRFSFQGCDCPRCSLRTRPHTIRPRFLIVLSFLAPQFPNKMPASHRSSKERERSAEGK